MLRAALERAPGGGSWGPLWPAAREELRPSVQHPQGADPAGHHVNEFERTSPPLECVQ